MPTETADRPLRAVNGMITSLHEARATHLAIVKQVIAAAGGQSPSRHLDRAYREAQRAGYLWHEFGDAHLIVGGWCPLLLRRNAQQLVGIAPDDLVEDVA